MSYINYCSLILHSGLPDLNREEKEEYVIDYRPKYLEHHLDCLSIIAIYSDKYLPLSWSAINLSSYCSHSVYEPVIYHVFLEVSLCAAIAPKVSNIS